MARQAYHGYCKQVMWPILHNVDQLDYIHAGEFLIEHTLSIRILQLLHNIKSAYQFLLYSLNTSYSPPSRLAWNIKYATAPSGPGRRGSKNGHFADLDGPRKTPPMLSPTKVSKSRASWARLVDSIRLTQPNITPNTPYAVNNSRTPQKRVD